MKYFGYIAAAAAMVAAGSLYAGEATEWYKQSAIDARLNVEVEKDTDVIHFIRTNNDPDVVTKTYILKHADPYELRGYLRQIVQTRRVDESPTGIQAIKYSDGTGIIMVSAEDYRFEDSETGQGIDTLIKTLDKPKVVSVTGQPMYVYNPKFRSAADLSDMVKNVGADVAEDDTENIGGSDRVSFDSGLNLLFFKTTNFSRANIENVLKEYDIPTAEVRAKITVYELYAENDQKLGVDFQAWKNNDGIDFFSTGGRFMKNYASDGSSLLKGSGWSDTTYFQFNPKWNTKYLDFLTSKGKAKVIHTGELTVRSGTTGGLTRTQQVFVAESEKIEDKSVVEKAVATVGDEAKVAAKLAKNPNADGTELEEYDVKAPKGKAINLNASNEFGFHIFMTPSVSSKATILDVTVFNSSLIGYKSNGEPRIQQGAKVSSSFMISNKGTKLVIGGLEKRDVVSVSGGIPLLKDLPLLGWLFSTESESTKRSQLVVVAEVIPVNAATSMPESAVKKAQKVEAKLGDAGESNKIGYRQFLIDPER